MAKILLVEDDKSLREIYSVRLQAEGYEIVSAGDGEEALALAIKERPDLIVSDVMMPKISGFDMLDILRSTTETKDVKVIMMTALSSDDQRSRGEALGADRYLVKSQVGIEDVVRTVHDVLADTPGAAAAPTPAPDSSISAPTATTEMPETPQPDTTPSAAPDQFATQPTPAPVVPAAQPEVETVPAEPTAIPPTPTTDSVSSSIGPSDPFSQNTPSTPTPTDPMPSAGMPDLSAPTPVSATPTTTAPADPVFPSEPSTQPQSPTLSTPTPEPLTPASPAPSPSPVINMPPEVPPGTAAPSPAPTAQPAATPSTLPEPTAPFSSPAPASLADRVINPLSPQDDSAQRPPNMSDLMNQELQNANPQQPSQSPPPPTPPVPPAPGQ